MGAILTSGGLVPTDAKLVNTLIERDLLKRVDDFRFEHRFPSRADAMRWLMDAALKAGLKPSAEEREAWA
jgi:hypothetical protein